MDSEVISAEWKEGKQDMDLEFVIPKPHLQNKPGLKRTLGGAWWHSRLWAWPDAGSKNSDLSSWWFSPSLDLFKFDYIHTSFVTSPGEKPLSVITQSAFLIVIYIWSSVWHCEASNFSSLICSKGSFCQLFSAVLCWLCERACAGEMDC